MRFSFGSILALCLCHTVYGDVELTTPASGASVAGGVMTLKWQDSGANPALAAIAAADLILCTGTNAAPQTLYTLAGSVALGSLTTLSVTVPVTIGANGQYFIKFVSTTSLGNVVITYSDRFTLTGMTGTVVANTGLAATGPAGTTPAAALLETAAATKASVTATTAASAVADANLAGYANQAGSVRSAPAQAKPGTLVTADPKTAKPLFPTSAYTIWTTYGPAPVAVTTITASPTWTVTSLENGVDAATFTGN